MKSCRSFALALRFTSRLLVAVGRRVTSATRRTEMYRISHGGIAGGTEPWFMGGLEGQPICQFCSIGSEVYVSFSRRLVIYGAQVSNFQDRRALYRVNIQHDVLVFHPVVACSAQRKTKTAHNDGKTLAIDRHTYSVCRIFTHSTRCGVQLHVTNVPRHLRPLHHPCV